MYVQRFTFRDLSRATQKQRKPVLARPREREREAYTIVVVVRVRVGFYWLLTDASRAHANARVDLKGTTAGMVLALLVWLGLVCMYTHRQTHRPITGFICKLIALYIHDKQNDDDNDDNIYSIYVATATQIHLPSSSVWNRRTGDGHPCVAERVVYGT